jgi:hypothetical protein
MDEQFHDVEFIRLDGEAIRVTSLRRDETTGELLLVAVARGSTAARELEKHGSKPVVQVEIPDSLDARHRMVSFDMRGVGEGERAIYRASFKLRPLADTAHRTIRSLPQQPSTPPSQLDRIEQKLDELLRLLKKDDPNR